MPRTFAEKLAALRKQFGPRPRSSRRSNRRSLPRNPRTDPPAVSVRQPGTQRIVADGPPPAPSHTPAPSSVDDINSLPDEVANLYGPSPPPPDEIPYIMGQSPVMPVRRGVRIINRPRVAQKAPRPMSELTAKRKVRIINRPQVGLKAPKPMSELNAIAKRRASARKAWTSGRRSPPPTRKPSTTGPRIALSRPGHRTDSPIKSVSCHGKTAEKKSCAKKTKVENLCWIHMAKKRGIRVTKSHLKGQGVFTAKKFKADAKVARVSGYTQKRRIKNSIKIKPGKYLNLRKSKGGRYLAAGNAVKECTKTLKTAGKCHGNNAKFQIHNKKASIVAKRTIRKGKEVFAKKP